jgi:hypothetical protein
MGKICEGLALEDVGIFYGHFVMWLFGIFFPVLVNFMEK